jgi:hypothetical protein
MTMTEPGAWKRANLVIEVAFGLYLLWSILPESYKLTFKSALFRMTHAEQRARERRADLEDFERRVLSDIHCLPEVRR